MYIKFSPNYDEMDCQAYLIIWYMDSYNTNWAGFGSLYLWIIKSLFIGWSIITKRQADILIGEKKKKSSLVAGTSLSSLLLPRGRIILVGTVRETRRLLFSCDFTTTATTSTIHYRNAGWFMYRPNRYQIEKWSSKMTVISS